MIGQGSNSRQEPRSAQFHPPCEYHFPGSIGVCPAKLVIRVRARIQ